MSDNAMSATRTSLLRAFGLSLNWGDDPDVWMLDGDYAQRAQDCLDFGLKMFYQGTLLPGEKTVWRWTFLTPKFDYTLVVDQETYDLPDDFNGFTATELQYSGDNRVWYPLSLVPLQQLQRERQRITTSMALTGAPQIAAYSPVAGDGSEGQRWQLDVFPKPDLAYSLAGSYYSNPYQITGLKPYPLGGQPHSLTLELAVIAAGEKKIEKISDGQAYKDFLRSYTASVSHDRAYFASQRKLGMNHDQGRMRAMPYPRGYGIATYNGQQYLG